MGLVGFHLWNIQGSDLLDVSFIKYNAFQIIQLNTFSLVENKCKRKSGLT